MAKKVLNLRSSEPNKKPTEGQLEFGQIAINFNDGTERIYIKNSTSGIVDFIPTYEVDNHIKENVKLSSGYTESNLSNEKLEPKPNETFEVAIGKLHKAIKDNEMVISAAFDRFKNSCGFDENGLYKPTNDLIIDYDNLSDAIDAIAEKTNEISTNLDSVVTYVNYMNAVGTIDSLTNVPTDKHLLIANISDTTQSLTLNGNLTVGKELHIIVYNTSDANELTITLPSSGDFVNITESTIAILPLEYGEINIISDGTKMYIRAL